MLRQQVTITSDGAVDCRADPPMLVILTDRGALKRPSSAKALKPLDGFEFAAVGLVVTDAEPEGPAALWYLDQREWSDLRHPAMTLWVLNMSITWPDAPLCFDRQWLADQQVLDLPRVTRGGASPQDYHRLADAYQALINFTENMRAASGRHRIGTDPEDGELAMARHAERLKHDNPTWTWLRIVHFIGLVAAIEDEGRSNEPETAALERLRRWRKRLRDLGE